MAEALLSPPDRHQRPALHVLGLKSLCPGREPSSQRHHHPARAVLQGAEHLRREAAAEQVEKVDDSKNRLEDPYWPAPSPAK